MEIIRGHGALQYGPQFGGMVNYILRNGSEIKSKIEVETQKSAGSYGMINTYTGVGGNNGKVHYYGFFDHRNAEGYRQNSSFFTNAGFGSLTYKWSEKTSLTAEVMQSHIRSQQPGGLSDSDIASDNRQSIRSRNWMDIRWTTMALIANHQINTQAKWNLKIFSVLGDRNSVGFMPSAGILTPDTINRMTLQYNPRNLNIDQYRNLGAEWRFIADHQLLGISNTVSGGLRFYRGYTHRFVADGKGSVRTDYDMQVSDGIWTRDLDFIAGNAAAFVENIFRVTDKFLVIPGVRYEYITGSVSGRNGFNGINEIRLQDQSRKRGFLLAGIGAEYHVDPKTEIYANISQAYRPIQFAELSAPPTTDVIDQNLRDAKGFNADLGIRGKLAEYLFFDVSTYWLQYNNRVGTLSQQRLDGSFYNFRTNVGNSSAKGIESIIDFNPTKLFFGNSGWEMGLFLSYAYNDARYGNFKVVTRSSDNKLVENNLKNKKVENAPEQILRTGLTLGYKKISLTTQYSHVGEAFSDANNTVQPSINGNNGLIPSYDLIDLTAIYTINTRFNLKTGVNNLTDARYFTRRAGGYPGPGALPADGRTWFITLSAKFN
jgi:Fe(3+) dicitrate transport protein